jgi:hypothetical protein
MKKAFVISPIGEPNSETRRRSDQVFNDLIKPVATDLGYELMRADHISAPGLITPQVISCLVTYDVVVADLTEHNPNVFYELAVCHALQKPVIQILEIGEGLPFDVQPLRAIELNHQDLDSVAQAKTKLRAQFEYVECNPHQISSPLSIVPEFSNALSLLCREGTPPVPQFGTRREIGDIRALAPHGHDYYLIGRSHLYLPINIDYFRSRLRASAHLGVLMMNIHNPAVLTVALAQSEPVGKKGQSSYWDTGMSAVAALVKEPGCSQNVTVKLVEYVSPLYIEAVDIESPNGSISLEIIFPLAAPGDRPVLLLTAKDHRNWFNYMKQRIMAIWDDKNARVVTDFSAYVEGNKGM